MCKSTVWNVKKKKPQKKVAFNDLVEFEQRLNVTPYNCALCTRPKIWMGEIDYIAGLIHWIFGALVIFANVSKITEQQNTNGQWEWSHNLLRLNYEDNQYSFIFSLIVHALWAINKKKVI